MQVPVHIDAAEGPFNRVNYAVLIAIQFLKMVMGQIEVCGFGTPAESA